MNIREWSKRVVKKMYWIISEPMLDVSARRNLRKGKNKKAEKDRINVLFIVQMPELWDKQIKVFELMKDSDYFEPRLLIVPKYDFVNSKLGSYSEELDFFTSFDQDALQICEIGDFDSFICNYDYVFYQRQYNDYLPTYLTNSNVIKYTRTCYIPYATPEITNTGLYGKKFYRNIYLAFLESEYARDLMIRKFKRNVEAGIQKFVFVGYPPFEKMMSPKTECQYFRLLWTPRWSYDPFLGGSHFFEYRELINNYAEAHPNLKVCIRPHPMMFDNFIKEKRMTEEDISVYIQDVKKSGATIDANKNITDTLQNTDILISDRSSVIPMFFMTGKPVIYCPIESDYGYLFQTIFPGLYIANTWDEMKSILESLTGGCDSLKEVRMGIIQEHFLTNRNASKNIVNVIYNDYYGDFQ